MEGRLEKKGEERSRPKQPNTFCNDNREELQDKGSRQEGSLGSIIWGAHCTPAVISCVLRRTV
jgi:hypothetical protein